MKPAWDKLIDEFAGSKDALVADVDCTSDGGKPLCSDHGIQGFPTIKWGDPTNLEKYEGGRDFDALKKFADENLKPMCGPAHIDLCDDEKKTEIETFMAMSDEDLEAKIAEDEKKLEEAESNFKDEVMKLQETYQNLLKDKEAKETEVKDSGLGLMKSCKAAKAKADAAKEEL